MNGWINQCTKAYPCLEYKTYNWTECINKYNTTMNLAYTVMGVVLGLGSMWMKVTCQ